MLGLVDANPGPSGLSNFGEKALKLKIEGPGLGCMIDPRVHKRAVVNRYR